MGINKAINAKKKMLLKKKRKDKQKQINQNGNL